MTVLAVFRSRAHSLHYAERLQGCGLCVRFDARYYARAEAIMKLTRYSSFKGFYKLDFFGGQTSLTPFVKK